MIELEAPPPLRAAQEAFDQTKASTAAARVAHGQALAASEAGEQRLEEIDQKIDNATNAEIEGGLAAEHGVASALLKAYRSREEARRRELGQAIADEKAAETELQAQIVPHERAIVNELGEEFRTWIKEEVAPKADAYRQETLKHVQAGRRAAVIAERGGKPVGTVASQMQDIEQMVGVLEQAMSGIERERRRAFDAELDRKRREAEAPGVLAAFQARQAQAGGVPIDLDAMRRTAAGQLPKEPTPEAWPQAD